MKLILINWKCSHEKDKHNNYDRINNCNRYVATSDNVPKINKL